MRAGLQTVRVALLASVLAASSRSAFALNPALDVSQYAHTAWSLREGFAKGAISTMVQTVDGYLWLGTPFGLLRFDGVRAVPWQPPRGQPLPSDEILHLAAGRDGTLWIGTTGGLASWNGRTVTRYPELGGLIMGVLEDREGSIWATEYTPALRRVCTIRDGRVACEDGSTRPIGYGLFEDRQHRVWVGASNGVWRWRPGPPVFFPGPVADNGIQGIAEDDDGALLMSVRGELDRLVDGRIETAAVFPEAVRRFQALRLLRDRDGGIWVGTLGGGIVHVHRGRTDVFTRSDGLSNASVRALYEDREGSIWVATDGGLDRFRESAVAVVSTDQGLSNDRVISIIAGKDDSVWLGTYEGLNNWKHGEVRQIAAPGMPPHGIQSMYEDQAGRLWIASGQGFGYLQHGRFVSVGPPQQRVNSYSIAEDAHGIVWVANVELGIVQLDARGSFRQIPLATFGRAGGDRVNVIAADRAKDGMWLGFERSGMAFVAGDGTRASYGVAEGLAAGQVTALLLDPDGTVWIGAAGGLSRLRGGRLATLTTRNGLPCDRLQWMLEGDERAVWMGTPCGVVRIARADLDAAADAAARGEARPAAMAATTFDSADGVRLTTSSGGYGPHAAKSADGQLWFTGMDGAGVIDPRHLPMNTLPPPVHVEQVVANRTAYEVTPAAHGLRLPPLVRDLQIDYTGLSLAAPEKVLFRYQLENFDRDWQQAGNRRQAFYTNVPPGTYRFRVIARNNSGVWNETGAALWLTIAPAYYQTASFRLFLVLAALALAGAIHLLRVRRLAHHYNLRMDARVAERTRIARDLHDTLLQSFQGLLLNFHAATFMLPERPADAKATLQDAIERASGAITEARDAVQGLRASTIVASDLGAALGALGEELANRHDAEAPGFRVSVEGTPHELAPILGDEVYRIAGEALRNAFRHARARHIEAELHYDPREFRVRVRDDGRGIEPDVRDRPGRNGHFGLTGMDERARLIGGRLTIWSELESGTEIELTIPSSLAYAEEG